MSDGPEPWRVWTPGEPGCAPWLVVLLTALAAVGLLFLHLVAGR